MYTQKSTNYNSKSNADIERLPEKTEEYKRGNTEKKQEKTNNKKNKSKQVYLKLDIAVKYLLTTGAGVEIDTAVSELKNQKS